MLGAQTVPAVAQSAYDARFVNYPTYSGDDLELKVDADGTHFRLWSPEAKGVTLNLYDNGNTGSALSQTAMTFDPQTGTWSLSFPEKLYGKFYTFTVTDAQGRQLAETPGVWAKAVGVNGNRAAIINLDVTDPKGWLRQRSGSEELLGCDRL